MKSYVSTVAASILRPFILRKMRFDQNEVDGVIFKMSYIFSEKEAAFRLVHDMYVRRGIISPSESGCQLSIYHLLPTTTIFIATYNDKVIGTISLIEDSPLGIPMEDVHRKEILTLRLAGLRFAEVGALAVTKDRRGKGISLMLYNIMIRWATQHRLIRNLAIAVHPRIETFFKVIFLFKKMGQVQKYKKLNNALSVPLVLDLSSAAHQFRRIYDRPSMHIGRGRTSINVYNFFCEDFIEALHLPEVPKYSSSLPIPPIWQHAEIATILNKNGIEFKSLPRQQKRVLSQYYTIFKEHNNSGLYVN